MQIAIASGKGGTGKTTIATNLAISIARGARVVWYLDCDVEEPNGHIFLKPRIESDEVFSLPVPQVNDELCNYCGKCSEICQYHAIVCLKDKVLVFEHLCHSCGGCMLICPVNAISEIPHPVGKIQVGTVTDRIGGDGKGQLFFAHGLLNIGDIHTPALIKAVRKKNRIVSNGGSSDSNDDIVTIIDAPPGTSCPVIEAVKGVDFVVLVTEPTPFGLNDLKLAVDMVRELGLAFGVVVNRSNIGKDQPDNDGELDEYCRAENIDIMMRIPDKRKIAEAYSRGKTIIEIDDTYRKKFSGLFDKIRARTANNQQ